MKRPIKMKNVLSLICLTIGLVLPSFPLAADENGINENFATLQGIGNSVSWIIDPDVDYESIKLTLSSSAGDFVTESEWAPSVGPLEDGRYTYELTVAPFIDSSTKEQMEAARSGADGQETGELLNDLIEQGKVPQQRLVQSGYFTILDGQFVANDAVEE